MSKIVIQVHYEKRKIYVPFESYDSAFIFLDGLYRDSWRRQNMSTSILPMGTDIDGKLSDFYFSFEPYHYYDTYTAIRKEVMT